jgi:aspartyl-tRNA(Asn)/glutamyl-tRNA(Gln) amidotransferase subunit B
MYTLAIKTFIIIPSLPVGMPKYKIGLEIHVYIDTQEKLFCSCPVDPNAQPNTTICPRCTGQPGSKPMLPNKEAIEKVIKAGLMLNCTINNNLVWQRKHYDWPDLPNGYQRTMSGSYAVPVGEHGRFLDIGIRELHLEEDPARWDPAKGTVDYNRSGYPLIEIVTYPDFQDVEGVRDWLKSLMTTLQYVHAVNNNLGVKCDVNVSVAPDFGRVEVKNLNSFKSIVKAISYELDRQTKQIARGRLIEQQTRAWVEREGKTVFMRSKEQALDYRFIPDPDLPVVEVAQSWLREIKKELPEGPQKRAEKLMKRGVDRENARIIASDLYIADFFDSVTGIDPVFLSKWIRKELLRVVNLSKKDFNDIGFNYHHLKELVELLEKEEITSEIGRNILEQLIQRDFSPKAYVKEQKLSMIKGKAALEELCKNAIAEKKEAVEDYRRGKEMAINAIVGWVMKETKGTAKPQEVKEIIKKLLK